MHFSSEAPIRAPSRDAGWDRDAVAIFAQGPLSARAMAPRMGQTKRCLAAVAPAPKGGAGAEEWRRHPRLQWHFRSFDASANQAAVLGRYRRLAAGASDREPVFRETTHVAAWVALLPLEAPLLPDCARLLSRLLRRRPCGARLPLWLRGTLHLMVLRLKELREEARGELAEHWLDLRRSMPGRVWKALRASCPAIDGTGDKERGHSRGDRAPEGRVRPRGRRSQPRRRGQGRGRAAGRRRVPGVRRRRPDAARGHRGCGAPLGSPRGRRSSAGRRRPHDRIRPGQAPRGAAEPTPQGPAAATRRGPGPVGSGNSSAPGAPPLEQLQGLLRGRRLGSVAHSDQWLELARVVGLGNGGGRPAAQPDSSRGKRKVEHKTIMTWRHENQGLKKLAKTAMANLGGQATSKELIVEILLLPESSSLSSAMSTDRRTDA